MPRRPSAKRYALALYQLGQERDMVERWQADLQTLSQALEDSELAAFLNMPRIRAAQKLDVLKEGLAGLDPLVYNFIGLLISRNMADSLPRVLEEYGKLLDQQRGRERAQVRSAVQLEAAQRDRLIKYLGDLVGKEIELTATVDTSVVGGLVARVGDRLIDASVKTKLQELKRSFAEAAY